MNIVGFIAIALLLSVGYTSTFTNTTEFWRKQLNYSASEMHFQGYAGIYLWI